MGSRAYYKKQMLEKHNKKKIYINQNKIRNSFSITIYKRKFMRNFFFITFIAFLTLSPDSSWVHKTKADNTKDQVSINGSVSIESELSYGLTEEVLYKALEYYESICSLEDVNNIRKNLGLTLVDTCVKKEKKS